MKYLLMTMLLLSGGSLLVAQNSLQVTIQNIENNKGKVLIGLYDNSDKWLSDDGAWRNTEAIVKDYTATYVFDDLPAGEYAVAIYHDVNGDEEINKNWLGIPQEPYGFSRNKKFVVKPPTFDEAAVKLNNEKQEIFIELQ